MVGDAARWAVTVFAAVPELPLARLPEVSLFQALLNYSPIKALLPIPVFIALAPVLVWFFGHTWAELDRKAREVEPDATTPPPETPTRAGTSGLAKARRPRLARGSRRPRPLSSGPRVARLRRRLAGAAGSSPRGAAAPTRYDYRPIVVFVVTAFVLTWQEYYGGRRFYGDEIKPWLLELEGRGHHWLAMSRFDELYSYAWWTLSRFIGYVLIPFPLYKALFPRDSLLDMGLRVRGFFSHLWIYGLCLAVVIPAMFLVASQPDFGTYYPFYKLSSRSWFDFALWEAMYWFQFLTLEMFFRGWMLGALRRSIGSAAIFAMAVPYCMIHYGKPYLETHGAIVAGIVLGSLAMHTRSIYAGFLVHVTVAFLMDFLALWKLDALPTTLFPW